LPIDGQYILLDRKNEKAFFGTGRQCAEKVILSLFCEIEIFRDEDDDENDPSWNLRLVNDSLVDHVHVVYVKSQEKAYPAFCAEVWREFGEWIGRRWSVVPAANNHRKGNLRRKIGNVG